MVSKEEVNDMIDQRIRYREKTQSTIMREIEIFAEKNNIGLFGAWEAIKTHVWLSLREKNLFEE